MMSRILAVLYGEEYDLPKKSGAYVIFKTLLDSGYDNAEKLHKEIINNQTDKYYLSKREFSFFTNELNNKGMIEQASKYERIYE